ncbi:gll4149 [Gloeobacter violaceus PCC 7421]|uniref:Gll4149 protein n=2 Tax=Gloeobacter violaceus TaxID=33072 RepID=Q7NDT3_GLOVI|nr:gll4149 [Gloeobacter violaceus PCC 7421]
MDPFACVFLPMPYQEISVAELQRKLASQAEGTQFVDVREPEELEQSRLDGFINLPLSHYQEWSMRLGEILDPQKETIVLCHHGMRSADMCSFLLRRGYENVKNVQGGIHAYSLYVDPNVPRYM